MRLLTLSLLMVMPVVLAGCDVTQFESVISLQDKMIASYDAGQYEQALGYCNIICEREADNYETLSMRAAINLQLKRNQEALEDAVRACDLRPGMLDAISLRGYAYSVNGMHAKAAEDLQTVIANSSVEPSKFVELGYEFEQLAEWNKAIKCYLSAVAIDAEFALAWNNMASVLSMADDEEVRDGEKAKSFASKALQYACDDYERCYAWDTLGAALAETGDFEAAVRAAEKAITFTDDTELIADIEGNIATYKARRPVRYKYVGTHNIVTAGTL